MVSPSLSRIELDLNGVTTRIAETDRGLSLKDYQSCSHKCFILRIFFFAAGNFFATRLDESRKASEAFCSPFRLCSYSFKLSLIFTLLYYSFFIILYNWRVGFISIGSTVAGLHPVRKMVVSR